MSEKVIERADRQLSAFAAVRIVDYREQLLDLPGSVLGAVVVSDDIPVPDAMIGNPYTKHRGRWHHTPPERLMGYERNSWRRVLYGTLFGRPALGLL